MGTQRTVWGIGTPRTLRPIWALAELGLDYEHKKILPRSAGMDDADFLALTKRRKIPFYQDDRVQIGESAAIVSYLADRHGGDLLPMPAPDSAEGAMLRDRTSFIMTEIDARMYAIRMHDNPPLGLQEIYGASDVAVDAARAYAERQFNEAARWMADGRHYVMGQQFGPADILLVSCLDWALLYKIDVPASLRDYRDRVAARPGYETAKASNDPSRAG